MSGLTSIVTNPYLILLLICHLVIGLLFSKSEDGGS
ncbi:Uncharacterised protein [Streptococcus parasanguinis]|nr:Uncharacterised protein [Streptococcus parasanguinis]